MNGLNRAAAPPQALPAEPGAQAHRRPFRPRRWQFVLAGLVLLAASAAAAALLLTSASATPQVVPNSLVELNPRTGKPVLVKRVGVLPGPIAITPRAIWTVNYGSDDVSRYDLRTQTVDTRGLTPGQPNDIAFDRVGNAWITNINANDEPGPYSVVTRIDAGAGGTFPGTVYPSHSHPIHVPLPFAGYAALGADHLWVIVGFHGPVPGDNRVAVVDVGTDQVSVLRLDESATAVAYGYDTAWIGTYGSSGQDDVRIEAFRAGHSKPVKIVLDKHGASWGPASIAVGDGAVWALTSGRLLKINPITLRVVRSLDLSAEQAGSVAVGAGAVWATAGLAGGNGVTANSVTKIDPRTDRIIRTFPLGNRTRDTCGIAATRNAIWVSVGAKSCDTIGS